MLTTNQHRFRDWIQEETRRLAQERYPNDLTKQLVYQIGFLQSQLAQAMSDDSTNTDRFRSTVRALKQ